MSAIRDFLTRDHQRLDALLARAGAEPGRVALEPYEEFRRGLLKHIGMEEMVLLPAAKKARGGKPVSAFERARLDHGALTALLIPSPRPEILAAIRTILAGHNDLEERDGGLYADCEGAVGAEAAALLDKLRAARDIPPAPHADGPHVEASLKRVLSAAGYAALLP